MLTLIHNSTHHLSRTLFKSQQIDSKIILNVVPKVINSSVNGNNFGLRLINNSSWNRSFSSSSTYLKENRSGKGRTSRRKFPKTSKSDRFDPFASAFRGGKIENDSFKFPPSFIKKKKEKEHSERVNAQVSSLLFQLKQKSRRDSKLQHINVEYKGEAVQFKCFPDLKIKGVLEDSISFFGLSGVHVLQHKDDSLLPGSAVLSDVFGKYTSITLQLVSKSDVYIERVNDVDQDLYEDEDEEFGEEEEEEEEEEIFIERKQVIKENNTFITEKGEKKTFIDAELSGDKPSNPPSRYFDSGQVSLEESFRSLVNNPKEKLSKSQKREEILKKEAEEEEKSKETEDNLKEKLKSFRFDGWVREQIKASNIYFDTELELENFFDGFEKNVLQNPLSLLNVIATELDPLKLNRKILPSFLSYINTQIKYFEKREDNTLEDVVNMRAPHEWYASARKMKRKVVCHVGPTNSGKTYSALQSLSEATSGIYCGPLRLLAYEIFEKLNEKEVPCNLVTGQQKIGVEGAQHTSCTVEMAELNKLVDVAVIDEIQMIGNIERGWAWTRAFLGIMAKEIHICGDSSALKLIKNMCELTGDSYEVKEYERLSPLKMQDKPMMGVGDIEKGDCIIAFSRNEIYDWKMQIEEQTGRKCCIIYGGLPPEARRQQAELFNNHDNRYDVLVASDAIGMGLNLNIRRIIFSKVDKFDGISRRNLYSTEVKQIAGRAGRFKSIYPEGKVTSLDANNNRFISRMLKDSIKQLPSAGILPSYEHLEEFSTFLKPTTRFHKLVKLFMEAAELDKNYFLCDNHNMTEIAKAIDLIPMTLKERYMFCIAPAQPDNSQSMSYLNLYAGQYSYDKKVDLSVDPGVIKTGNKKKEIQELETLHNVCDLYIWLSYRATEFHERELAQKTKQTIVDRIRACLTKLGKPISLYDETEIKFNTKPTNKKIKQRKKGQSLYDDLEDDEYFQESEEDWSEFTMENIEEYISGRR